MLKTIFKTALSYIKQFIEIYKEIAIAKFRNPIYKTYVKERDIFMLICFSELMGIPNPVSFYTLELYPEFYEYFHEWHIRMGMEKSPFDGFQCC
ncbi:MAG: hypothetical protein OEV44_02255 [Spirochaetota bacterium]|nr:hypothetical protein [Spirochaetota bacterium]